MLRLGNTAPLSLPATVMSYNGAISTRYSYENNLHIYKETASQKDI